MNRSPRILLVDDEVAIQRAVAPLLRSRGYEVEVAGTGKDAVTAVVGRRPDLIVLDLGLPDLDGWEVLRRVRGLDPEKGSTQLVLNGATAFARFEVNLNSDGSFNFPKLPQGTYIPSLEGGVTSTSLTPNSITVTGTELAGVELAMQTAGTTPPNTENPSKGATLADFGLGGRARANESAAVANIRTINTAQITYLSASQGNYGSLEDLIKAGLLDESFRGVKAGFNYSLIAAESDYAASAIPANSATGRYGFYSLPDAVVRYSTFELLAPPEQSSRPVQ